MANKPVEASIKCPFYVKEKDNMITCEGSIQGTCMITKFKDAKSKKQHFVDFCFLEDGGNCPLAKSVFNKYGSKSLLE